MPNDWLEALDDNEHNQWDEFVRHFRHDVLTKIDSSAFVLQLVPDAEHFDVKFAVELGAAVMLDKPMLAVVAPGVGVSEKLRAVCDEVIVADIDTQEGQHTIAEAIKRVMGKGE